MEQLGTIKINIKGDKITLELYEKIKNMIYETDIKYFDIEVKTQSTSHFSFRNNLNKNKK